jgi:large subunit ribosomal protein L23
MAALMDFLKKKEDAKKSKKPEKKTEKVLVAPVSKVITGNSGFSFDIIKEPHISEKGSYLAEKDQYIFQVNPRSNKQEIKKAIKGIYGVDVLSVNIIQIPAKKRRLGKTQGFRKAFKKAIVRIKEGQKIEIL